MQTFPEKEYQALKQFKKKIDDAIYYISGKLDDYSQSTQNYSKINDQKMANLINANQNI